MQTFLWNILFQFILAWKRKFCQQSEIKYDGWNVKGENISKKKNPTYLILYLWLVSVDELMSSSSSSMITCEFELYVVNWKYCSNSFINKLEKILNLTRLVCLYLVEKANPARLLNQTSLTYLRICVFKLLINVTNMI